MKLKHRCLFREVAGQWVAVAVGKGYVDFNGMVKLNGTGVFVMERLNQGEQTYEELLEAILERYDVTRERAEATLDAFLRTLEEGGLLLR